MLSSSPIFCCSKYNAASLSWQMCETMALNSLKDNINCTSNFWFETFYLLYYILWYFNIVHKYGVLNMLLKYCYHQHCINFNHIRLAIAVLFARLYQKSIFFWGNKNLHSINSEMSWFWEFYELQEFVFIYQKLLP